MRQAVVGFMGSALLLAGCGGGEPSTTTEVTSLRTTETESSPDPGSASGTPTAEAAPSSTPAPASSTPTEEGPAGGPGETVEFTTTDYVYVGLPEEVVAGSRMKIARNDSESELHHATMYRWPESDARSVEEITQLEVEEIDLEVVGRLGAIPGRDSVLLTGLATLDEPGRYLFLCEVPLGVDDRAYREAYDDDELDELEQEVGEFVEHYRGGMYAELQVVTAP